MNFPPQVHPLLNGNERHGPITRDQPSVYLAQFTLTVCRVLGDLTIKVSTQQNRSCHF